MKVILIENIKELGKVGEIKDVSDGYGKNFLIPKNKAILATKENIDNLKRRKEKEELELKNKIEELKKRKEDIEKENRYKISVKSNKETGKLFGSLTKKDIESLFNFEIKEIKMPSIKMVGMYEIELDLGNKVKAKINVEIN